MAREFFKDLPNTTTPLTASRLNGLLNGDEALGSIVVDDVNCKNMFDKGSFVAGDRKDAQPTIRISSRQVLYLEPGTYTFSTDLDTSVYRYEINTISSPAPVSSYDVLYGSGWKTTSTLTITIDNSTKGYFNLGVARINNSSLTISDISSANFQLEKGSTATEYTEYKQPVKKTSIGVKESCTFYANDFKCKNLFSGIMYNGIINQNGAYITNNARITNTTSNGFFLPAGTYTLSIADLDACTIVIKNASGTVIQDLADSWKTLPFTFTTTQDGYICFSAKKNNDATLDPNDYAPQLEIGSTATSYTKGKHIIKEQDGYVKEDTTFYANDFKCRNMLGFSNIRNGIYKIGDGTYDGSGTNACCTASKIEIDNTKNYVLSTANTQTTSYMYVMYYDASGTYLGYINTSFSTGFIKLNTYSNYSNAKYVNFRFDVPIANLINPQLEIGSEATSYTPYKNFDTTIKSKQISGTTSANGNLSSGLNKNTTVVLCFHANNNNAIPTFYTNTASNEWTVHISQVSSGQALANTSVTGILYYIDLYPSSSTSGTRMLNVVNEGDGENR